MTDYSPPPLNLRPAPLDADGKRLWVASVEVRGQEYGASSEYPAAALANLVRKLAVVLEEATRWVPLFAINPDDRAEPGSMAEHGRMYVCAPESLGDELTNGNGPKGGYGV